MITNSEKIRIIAKRKNVTMSELARRINTTRQSLNSKLKRDSFTPSELEIVAEALGCRFVSYFEDLLTGEIL